MASIIVNICEINWKYIGNTLDGMANIYFLIRGWGEVLASIIGRAGKRKTGVNGGLSPVTTSLVPMEIITFTTIISD